jgi:hypothetical protein
MLALMTGTLVAIGLVVGLSNAAFGQSLAELAKKTEERRNAKKADEQKNLDAEARPPVTKVYTNKDLTATPASSNRSDSSAPAPITPAVVAAEDSSEDTRAAAYRQIARKDEAYWKNRMRDLQGTLDADEIHLAAMSSRLAALSADFSNTDSVSQRVVLRRERENAATEVTRLKAEVVKDKKAIDTLEEEARRASVPPGWLRP